MPISTLKGYPRIGGVIGYGPVGGSGVWKLQERYALADDFYDDVSLLLKMNGANGSTTFLDSSKHGHAVTANGDAQISTTESKFGGSSAYFDGTGDYLSIPNNAAFSFGSGDFTLEAWVYLSASVSYSTIADARSADVLGAYLFGIDSNRKVDFLHATRFTSTSAVSLNTWTHVALSREGATMRFFIDGVLDSSTTDSATINANNSLAIGGGRSTASSSVTGYYFNGYIDSLRITKGQARYKAAFTPPQRDFLP